MKKIDYNQARHMVLQAVLVIALGILVLIGTVLQPIAMAVIAAGFFIVYGLPWIVMKVWNHIASRNYHS